MVAGAGSVKPMSHVLSLDYLETQMSTIEKHLKVCMVCPSIYTSLSHIHVRIALYIFFIF